MIFLSSLTSDGGQYINTGILPTGNTRLILDADVTSADLGALFGARSSYRSNGFALFVSEGHLQHDHGSSSAGVTASGTGRHLFEKRGNLLLMDGTLIHTGENSTFSCPYPMAILSINSGGTMMTAYPVRATVYSAQIYEGETLLLDLVPALAEDGTPGFYDKCTGGFYRNAGTGVFVPGTPLKETFSVEFTGLAKGREYVARVYPVSPEGIYQSELGGQTASAFTTS